MKTKRPKGTSRKVQTAKISAASSPDARRAVIEVERSGDWMPADELRAAALVVLAAGDDSALNLDGIDHLDASAMQILLALDVEQKNRGRHLHLLNASPRLRQWFELSGAADQFLRDQWHAHE